MSMQRIAQYWSNEAKIKEARKTFFDKGIVRRELVEDNLAFSWLRCKYKNLQPSDMPKSNETDVKRIPIQQVKKLPLALSEMWLGLFDATDHLVRFTGSLVLGQQFSKWAFHESAVGFNGIGTAFETRSIAITVGFEHYNEHLCAYVTVGIPIGNQTIGVVLPLHLADDELLDNVLSLSFDKLLAVTEGNPSTGMPEVFCFRQDIEVYKNCYRQFKKLSAQHAYLKISANSRFEALLVAKSIHKIRQETGAEFVHLSGGELSDYARIEKLEQGFKGTIYLENLRWTPWRVQQRINKIIDSKLINSKAVSNLYNSDIAILTSDFSDKESMLITPEEHPGLQMKLAKVNLVIPKFSDIGHQFKPYLYSEFERLCSARWHRDIRLSEEALNALTLFAWPNQYRELVYVADFVSSQEFEGSEAPLTALPAYILKASEDTGGSRTLRDVERLWIEKTLKETRGNVKRTAEILGITRATLYKKMEIYQIQLNKA